MSPGERDEEPPDENEDFVLNFEDLDKLPAHDLDRITAWMESMLASLCQLGNVKVSVPPCLCLVACAVYQRCLPVLSTNGVYLCCRPVLSTPAVCNTVYLCCIPVHLPDVQKTTWHVWNTYSHALSHTLRSAVRAVM